MSYQTLQEMSREQVEEIASAQQKLALQLAEENDRLRKLNKELNKSYYALRDKTVPKNQLKHLKKVASCLLASAFFGVMIVPDPGTLYSAAVFFIGSFLLALALPCVLEFFCEITDEKFINEKAAPFAPYLIIPLVYLFIVMNFR